MPSLSTSASVLAGADRSAAAAGSDWLAPHGWRRLNDRLLRLVARRAGCCADDARDLVQDAWLRMLEQRAQGQPTPHEPAAWLTTVVRHLAVDQQRRARVRQPGGAGAPVPLVAEKQPDAADSVMYGQALVAVEAALSALPPRARDAFLAHRLHGQPQADIAQRHGVHLNTIERDLALAHARLQRALLRWRGEAPPMRPRRQALSALLGVVALAGSGVLGAQLWQGWRDAQARWQWALDTRRGQRARQRLPDGSSIALDADTQVRVRYDSRQRQVQLLRGALFADVAHEPARPFVVEATLAARAGQPPGVPLARVRITALGTRFGVEHGPAGVAVRVEQGRVRVQWLDPQGRPRDDRVLHAGQGLRLSGDGDGLVPLRAGLDAAPWRHGRVQFDREPLAQAVQRLARYQVEGAPVIEVDAPVARLVVSGQASIDQAGDWVRALPDVLPVRVQQTGQRWRVAPR